jgi:1-acyl-sn-glycerol-3-phosphate acyltransferase
MTESILDQSLTENKSTIKKLENNGKKDFAYMTAQKALKLTLEKVWRDKFKVVGAENIPAEGSAIVASNHLTFIDPMFLMAAIDRPVHFLGRQDKEFDPFINRVIDYPLLGVIGTSTKYFLKGGGKKFIRQVDEVVRNKELIFIFPEKIYVQDKKIKDELVEFAPGVFHLAQKYGLPIIPVHISGIQNVRPSLKTDPLHRIYVRPVEVVIGKAIPVSEIQNSEQIRQAIIGLRSGSISGAA